MTKSLKFPTMAYVPRYNQRNSNLGSYIFRWTRNQVKRISLTYAINLCIVVWQRIWSENKKRTKNYIKPFLYFICNSEVATAVIFFAAVFTPKVCDNMMPLPTQLKFF